MSQLVNANDRCVGFKSTGQAQRFLAIYGVVGNLFSLGPDQGSNLKTWGQILS